MLFDVDGGTEADLKAAEIAPAFNLLDLREADLDDKVDESLPIVGAVDAVRLDCLDEIDDERFFLFRLLFRRPLLPLLVLQALLSSSAPRTFDRRLDPDKLDLEVDKTPSRIPPLSTFFEKRETVDSLSSLCSS